MGVDFSDLNVKGDLGLIKKYGRRYGGDIRLFTGRVYSEENYESWREEVLRTPLP